jgi:hypothetical protein
VFQTPLGVSNVSAFSARSAVKLGGLRGKIRGLRAKG